MSTRFLPLALAFLVTLPACGGNGTSTGTGGSGASGASTSSGGAGTASSAGGSGGSSGGGSGGSSIADCGAYEPGDDLNVCIATYLGGPGPDRAAALDIASDGTIVWGGAISGNDFGLSPTALLGGGDGAVVRLSPTGNKVLSITRIGKVISDLEIRANDGAIAVSGDFGVAVLDPMAAAVLWKADVGGAADKVAAGSDGTVAVLTGKTIHVLGPEGAALATVPVSASAVNDIALDGASHSVFVTGYKQDDGGPCTQYKSTFIRAFGYDGKALWKSYDWTHDEVGATSDCADTTGLVLGMGRDGKLYYAGKSDGGNTVHQKDPRDLAKKADNAGSDSYNQPFGLSGANAIGYYARFNPAGGLFEKGQFVLVRKGDGKGNAAVPSAITADEKGNVFVAGSAAFQIENHDKKKIDGNAVGPYVAYEAFALIVPPDFSKRLTWTVFTKSGPADARAIAAGHGAVAFAANQGADQVAKGTLLTVDPLQSTPAGDAESYLATWAAP